MPSPPRIQVNDLTFTFPEYPTGVRNVTLDLPPRSRTLLIGANGSGVTYLGLDWVTNPIVRHDVGVVDLLRSVGGDACPERRDTLVSVLDIDTNWRLHPISDGERRRVQLAMGLLRPWTILNFDEITVDLDLLSHAAFLGWLKLETKQRECTIIYATHILDNLAGWPSHLVHMSLGTVKEWGETDKMLQGLDSIVTQTGNSRLASWSWGG